MKHLLKVYDLSITDLARECDFKYNAAYKYVVGLREPSLDDIKKIKIAIGCDYSTIITALLNTRQERDIVNK